MLRIAEDGHELGLGIDFLGLGLGHHDSREDAGGLVPALIQVIDGPLVDFLGPISGALVATDVHSNLLLELVNAEHVQGLEAQAEGGEHERSPTEDEKDGKYLDTEKGAVTAVKPGQRRTQDENSHPRKRREIIETLEDRRITYKPTWLVGTPDAPIRSALLKNPHAMTPHAPPNRCTGIASTASSTWNLRMSFDAAR